MEISSLGHLPNPNPSPDANLRPASSTAFKREARKKRKGRKRVRALEEKLEALLALDTQTRTSSDSAAASTVEWPTASPSVVDSTTGWAVVAQTQTTPPAPPPPSVEDQARAASLRAQQNALAQCQVFFSANEDDHCGDDYESEDDGESGPFRFFVELFERDEDLRGLYEKNWEKGEFCCLVCGSVGEKIGKRYANCAGLAQHANTVSKTKRREGHRAFARAVCGVLGWDIAKLPGVLDPHSGNSMKQTGAVEEELGQPKSMADSIGLDEECLGDYMEDADSD